jgi:hypothetical protein
MEFLKSIDEIDQLFLANLGKFLPENIWPPEDLDNGLVSFYSRNTESPQIIYARKLERTIGRVSRLLCIRPPSNRPHLSLPNSNLHVNLHGSAKLERITK